MPESSAIPIQLYGHKHYGSISSVNDPFERYLMIPEIRTTPVAARATTSAEALDLYQPLRTMTRIAASGSYGKGEAMSQ